MKNENDIIVLGQEGGDSKIPYYKQTIQIDIHNYYITGVIGAPEKYLDLINTLKTCDENSQIILNLNTLGGDLDTAVQIMAAMDNCIGTVITSLEGKVCSAGSLLFLAGHRHIVNRHSTLMIHNYSCGLYETKGNEAALQVAYNERYFKKLSYDIYKDFLTDDEIEKMLDGRDIWLDSDEVLERLERMQKIAEDSAAEVVEQIVEEAVEASVKPSKTKKA